jgi:hypothetical protein
MRSPPLLLLREEVFVQPFELDGPADPHAGPVLDHEVGELPPRRSE